MGIINYFPLHLSRRIWDIHWSFPKTWLIIFMSLFPDFSGFAMHHFILVPGRSRFTFYRVRHMKAIRRCERSVICFKCHSCKLYPHLSKSSMAGSQHHQLHSTLPSLCMHALLTPASLLLFLFVASLQRKKEFHLPFNTFTHINSKHMLSKLWFRFMYASCLLFFLSFLSPVSSIQQPLWHYQV